MIAAHTENGIATITLDRPAARNAIPRAGWHALTGAIAAVPPDAHLAVLRAAGPGAFSAGADLAELARLADHPAEREPFRVAMRTAIEAFAALPMPTAAVIAGGCFGAAVALALAADLRLATPAARFAIPPARLGIAYPAEDVARLASRVGEGAAARLLFTGAQIDAGEALRLGLVDELTDAPDAILAGIAANDRAALVALKRMLRDPHNPAHAAAFDDGFASDNFRAATARYRASSDT